MTVPVSFYHYGDVWLAALLSADTKPMLGLILLHGELTGHDHRIRAAGVAQLFTQGDLTYLRVRAAKTTLVQEEPRPIELPTGIHRVWQQRDYTPTAVRTVPDC